MTQNFLILLQTLFNSAWKLLTSFYVPGTNVTPAGILIFIASAVIGIKFFKRLFSAFGGDSSSKSNQ